MAEASGLGRVMWRSEEDIVDTGLVVLGLIVEAF